MNDEGTAEAGTAPEAPEGGRSGSGPSLTAQTVRGFAWAFTGTVGQALLQVVSMVVLSRLLTPNESGMATAAMLVVGFSQLVSQIGVGPALVQRRTLDDREVAAAFYCSLVFSVLLAVLLAVFTPYVNLVVGLPADSILLRLLTVALVLVSLSAVPMGLLQRDLRFRAMALVDFLAFGPATIGTSITLAALGYGAISVIWGQIAGAIVTATGYHLLARPPMRLESPAAMWRAVRPLLGFGSGYSLSQVGNWFALNADNLVVTNTLGTWSLGIYGRAYQLLSQPANIIGSAVDKALFPAMAKVRDDGERLRGAYVRAASLIALATVPTSAALAVLAPEVIRLLLGDQWLAVIVPLQVFAVVLLPRASYKISGSLTRATGAVFAGAWRQWLYAGEVLGGCAVGAWWGVNGVAVGASVAIVLHFFVMLRFSARVAPGLMRDVLRMYVKHLPIAAVSYGTAQVVALAVRPTGSIILTMVLTLVAWALGTALALMLLRGWFRDELDVVLHLVRPGSGGGPGDTSSESASGDSASGEAQSHEPFLSPETRPTTIPDRPAVPPAGARIPSPPGARNSRTSMPGPRHRT
ncbi:MAG: hypothetical protein QG622_211 [Actinomycetota bacterium]|nr:hypothetical protein [Actinomycetota bacterium]